MKKYLVKVTETLARHVIIEAENDEDAANKVEDAYSEGKIVLDYDDYSDCEVTCKGEAKEIDFGFYNELEVDNE